MPHPDLNALRQRVNEQKSTGKRGTKRKSGRSGYFLLVPLFVGYLLYFQIDVVMNYYNMATDFVQQSFWKNEEVDKGDLPSIVMNPIPTQYVLVQTKGANIRSEANINSNRVTVVGEGERLEYLNQFASIGDMYWLRVQLVTGEVGWISDRIVLWDKDSMAQLVTDAEKNVAAMLTLATFYEKGIAVDKFEERSLYWYGRAAFHGDEQSQLLVEAWEK